MISVKTTYQILLSATLSFCFNPAFSQVELAFQGGEPGNSWNFVSSGADATAQAQAFLLNNIVSGTQSLVVGGNTGGGSCIDGGSGNGPSTPRFFTFDPIDISSSSESFRSLNFHWGTRQPICVGTGWDSGENLVFTAYHDGVAQPSETLAVGNNNANFSIQNHTHTHVIPPCVNSFYFHITVTTNRRDELLFLDDVLLTAPQLNAGGGTGTNVNLSICQSQLPYNWNGLIFNQAGTQTVTLTNSYGCDSLVNYILSIDSPTTPTFNIQNEYCANASIPALPNNSLNGISGIWSPTINNTTTTTYTFTPAAGQCASSTTTNIEILPNVNPIFNQVDAICSGAVLNDLPSTSQNNISGIWSPVIDNMSTTTYTFAPSPGQCASEATMTISVIPNETPTFEPLSPFCSGSQIASLPTTSQNNITGTWSPAINNQATTTYTFTPSTGQCAVNQTLSIEIQPNIEPVFNSPGTYCIDAVIPDLPSTSLNNISGTWSPAINNTQTTNYTFTPNSGLCATTTNLTISVSAAFTPEFINPGAYCEGATIPALPTTSLNGINGVWAPQLNNTTTTTYTFTPLPNQCAEASSLTIEITPNVSPNFTSTGSFCAGDSIPDLPTQSINAVLGSWSPVVNNQTTTTYTFTPDSNQCALQSSTTIEINPIIVPLFELSASYCFGESISDLPELSINNISGSWSPIINNTSTTTYTFTPDAGFCSVEVLNTIVVYPLDSTFTEVTTCQNQLPYLWQGMALNTSGIYHQSILSSHGCDSVLVLDLSIVPNIIENQNITICTTDFPYSFFGQEINSPGVFEHTTNNVSGCDTTYILNLGTHQPLSLTFNQAPISSCDEPLDLIFSVSSTHQVSQCNWTMNDLSGNNCEGFNVNLSEIGCYDLAMEATDIYGCVTNILQPDMACIHPNPNASFYFEEPIVDAGQYIQPYNLSNGASLFVWDFGDDSAPISGENPQHTYDTSGEYEIILTAINSFGCIDEYSQLIAVRDPLLFYVPNAFTPGGLDLNEFFTPVFTSGINRDKYRMVLFNRWGEVMFESLHPDKGWDGNYGTLPCPSGVYVWQIEFENARGTNEMHRGHVNLLR
jgi:gliding motility-associated-like protein